MVCSSSPAGPAVCPSAQWCPATTLVQNMSGGGLQAQAVRQARLWS